MMNKDEEKQARDKKLKYYHLLCGINLDKYNLEKTDIRLREYVENVRADIEGHNLYEILAAYRFFVLRDHYIWKSKAVKRFILFYESLKFSGMKGRQCYKLTPIQVFQFASILGFYVEEEEGGKRVLRRLVRRAILFVPRKFSKTTSSSSLAVNELLFGDANAQAYTAANGYKQAQVCFKEISKIVKQLDPKRRTFKSTREHIEWRANKFGKESFVECLSGGADTKDGLNASLIIFDEYAAAKYVKDHSEGAELLQVLESSSGARDEYLTVIITTASRVIDGPFMLELEIAKKILLGEYEDDTLFASLFMPDEWEMEGDSLGDPDLWKKCNPHIGVTVKESFYRNSYKQALRDPEKMLEFKTKLLNIFVSAGSKVWISQNLARSLSDASFCIDNLSGRPPTMVSMDLSVSDDISAVNYMIYSKTLKKFYSWTDYYIPEKTLEEHPNAELYKYWIAKGYLKVCPGAVISDAMIVTDILKRNRKLRILQIGYDAYKSQEIVNSLGAAIASEGYNPEKILKAVPQTFGAFTSPVETFEMAAKKKPAGIALSDNPITFWMFGNAYLEEDRMENKKPLKRKENAKIDGVIVNLMSIWLFNNYVW
jgi:phage terminase large subunit-like protein|nr:MAG TPA: Large Terminase [Caudoviricetes sp.]